MWEVVESHMEWGLVPNRICVAADIVRPSKDRAGPHICVPFWNSTEWRAQHGEPHHETTFYVALGVKVGIAADQCGVGFELSLIHI